jgi:low affinity Fe/Cu permease
LMMDMNEMVDRCMNVMGSMMGASILLIVLIALLLVWVVGLGAVGALIFWGVKRLSRSHP